LNVRPASAARRGNLAAIELAGNRVLTGVSGGLNFPNERQDIGRELTRPGLEGFAHALSGRQCKNFMAPSRTGQNSLWDWHLNGRSVEPRMGACNDHSRQISQAQSRTAKLPSLLEVDGVIAHSAIQGL
jgi:hypothetical protein